MISNFYLPFSTGTIAKQDTRPRPSKYDLSQIRNWDFEQSDGLRFGQFGVYKYLPAQFKDINTEDYVAIPKGRVVSSIPVGSGNVYIGFEGSYSGAKGSAIAVGKTTHFGYAPEVTNLLVPANGGIALDGFYSSRDALGEAETIKSNGVIAREDDSFTLEANAPIGVTFTDIYQDVRGKWINYENQRNMFAILSEGFMQVPFIDYSALGAASGCCPRPTNSDSESFAKWSGVNSWFTYMAFDSKNEDIAFGAQIVPDLLGNYALQGAASGTTVLTTPRTPQTIGRLMALDVKFPKNGMEDVLTAPRSGMTGSQTAGIDKNLFDFAWNCLYYGTDAQPTIEEVYNAVRSGAFGIARFQLSIK